MTDEAKESKLLELCERWAKNRAHTYASENADLYRGFDNGAHQCASELRAILAEEPTSVESGEDARPPEPFATGRPDEWQTRTILQQKWTGGGALRGTPNGPEEIPDEWRDVPTVSEDAKPLEPR